MKIKYNTNIYENIQDVGVKAGQVRYGDGFLVLIIRSAHDDINGRFNTIVLDNDEQLVFPEEYKYCVGEPTFDMTGKEIVEEYPYVVDVSLEVNHAERIGGL